MRRTLIGTPVRWESCPMVIAFDRNISSPFMSDTEGLNVVRVAERHCTATDREANGVNPSNRVSIRVAPLRELYLSSGVGGFHPSHAPVAQADSTQSM